MATPPRSTQSLGKTSPALILDNVIYLLVGLVDLFKDLSP